MIDLFVLNGTRFFGWIIKFISRYNLFIVILIAGFLSLSSEGSQQYHKQNVAIVIGNSDYKQLPLKNPINDAKAVSAALRSYGFDVSEFYNIKAQESEKISEIIKSKVSSNTTFIFYYAGHGVQVNGANYFPNVDSNFKDLQTVQQSSIWLNNILKEISLSNPKAAVVVLDACRDNPFESVTASKDSYKGLARAISPPGTVIFYATRPGSTASDGNGENGLFTEVLLKEISNPQLPLELLFRRVSSGVFKSSKGEQEPWVEGVIREEIIIAANQTGEVTQDENDQTQFSTLNNNSLAVPEIKELQKQISITNDTPIKEVNLIANNSSSFVNQTEALRSLRKINLKNESLGTYFYCENNECQDYLSAFKEMRNKKQFPKLIDSAKNITLCQYNFDEQKCTSDYFSFGTGVNPLVVFQALFGSDVIARSIQIKALEQSNGGGITFASEPNISVIRSRLNISNNAKCTDSAGRVELMSDKLEFEIATNTCIAATPPIPAGFKLTFDVLAYDHTNKDFYVRWKAVGYSFMYYSAKEGIGRVSFR